MKTFSEYIAEKGKTLDKYLTDFGSNQYSVYGSTIILKADGKSVDIMDDSLDTKVKKEILKITGKDANDTIKKVYDYMSTLNIKMAN